MSSLQPLPRPSESSISQPEILAGAKEAGPLFEELTRWLIKEGYLPESAEELRSTTKIPYGVLEKSVSEKVRERLRQVLEEGSIREQRKFLRSHNLPSTLQEDPRVRKKVWELALRHLPGLREDLEDFCEQHNLSLKTLEKILCDEALEDKERVKLQNIFGVEGLEEKCIAELTDIIQRHQSNFETTFTDLMVNIFYGLIARLDLWDDERRG